MSRHYTAPDGTPYPLTEARYPMDFKSYKSDRRKAKQGDPRWCWQALGVRRLKNVIDVYIGAGRDAYVIFKGENGEEDYAVHFTIRMSLARMIREFDKDRKAKTILVRLDKPARSWRLDYRRQSNARRRAAVKAGAAVKKQERRNPNRVEKYGVAPRPRAPISKSGSVNVEVEAAA